MRFLPPSAACAAFALAAALCAAAPVWPAEAAAPQRRYDPNIELPDSDGRNLVLRSCTMCHELRGLAAYKGYWGLKQWKQMVEDMVKNGAVLSPAEQDIVAAYLTRHFGPS
ncbi:MAG: hypothetical protein LBE59_01630 [Nevskiaceae bacterium]|jgi:cytochrome c5|nr:hypothetical protein [Nevskiaceae bacterium]